MVVSIDDQVAYVYRNGVQIARSTVSTGRVGKETPTGVFTILERNIEHESSIYKGAKMPYMQRLTWSGIAIHAGDLPGYPASAGCVRMPYAFSQKVYGVLEKGSTVVISKSGSEPSRSSKPADILLASRSSNATNRAIPNPQGKVIWQPYKSPSGPYSILMSYADRTVYVWRNGIQIGQAPLTINGMGTPPQGVFMRLEGGGAPWTALSLNGSGGGSDAINSMRTRISVPESFRRQVSKALTPGTILVAAKGKNNTSTHSSPNFKILAPES